MQCSNLPILAALAHVVFRAQVASLLGPTDIDHLMTCYPPLDGHCHPQPQDGSMLVSYDHFLREYAGLMMARPQHGLIMPSALLHRLIAARASRSQADKDIHRLFVSIDHNCDGTVSLMELVEWVSRPS